MESVIYLTEQSGAEICRKHISRKFHLITAFYTIGHFINLYLSYIAFYTDNLAFKGGITHKNIAYFVHRNVSVEFYRHQISVYAYYLSFIFGHCFASNLSPFKMESYIFLYAFSPLFVSNCLMRRSNFNLSP